MLRAVGLPALLHGDPGRDRDAKSEHQFQTLELAHNLGFELPR